MMEKLLVVATIAYDAIETPFDKVPKVLGGAATYIALAASKFKINCGLVSVIGYDFEDHHLELLRNNLINCDGIELIKAGKTFFWSGKYHDNMNIRTTLYTELNVVEKFTPKIPKYYLDSKVLMIGNLDPRVQLEALVQVKNNVEFIMLDTMNFWIKNSRDILDEVISKVDLICVNDEESRLLTNEVSLINAGAKIQKMGPDYVIIKKGENGSILFGDNKIFVTPAFPVNNVIDPTGAGDSFAGGIAGFLSNNSINFENIKKSIVYGTVLASFTVESFGVDSLEKVSNIELQKRLNKFKDLTSF